MTEQKTLLLTLRWVSQFAEIPQGAWDSLARPLATPFLEWEWLNNLETSGSATAQTGWQPCHLTVWREGNLIAGAPLYLKAHSYGEFVFDHQWADLAHRLNTNYYPKLLGMTPFTPAVGYRFLMADGENEEQLTGLMVTEIDRFCGRNQISGCHFLFVDPEWGKMLQERGFSRWLHHSYIWQNQDFKGFNDYLGSFNSNQRKNIKRERRAVEQAGLRLEILAGDEIPRPLFAKIYSFYSGTCDKFFWGSKYLTRKFFAQLYPDYRDRVLLFAAYREDAELTEPVALSFCIHKGENLYGRYWGSFEEFDHLHFEACYYRPIEWAIGQGVKMFDPGAGGKHKRRRGFPATANYSLHRFYDERLRKILHAYIGEINEMEQREIEAINEDLPFTKDDPQWLLKTD